MKSIFAVFALTSTFSFACPQFALTNLECTDPSLTGETFSIGDMSLSGQTLTISQDGEVEEIVIPSSDLDEMTGIEEKVSCEGNKIVAVENKGDLSVRTVIEVSGNVLTLTGEGFAIDENDVVQGKYPLNLTCYSN